jgi:hypothetical protein
MYIEWNQLTGYIQQLVIETVTIQHETAVLAKERAKVELETAKLAQRNELERGKL